MAKEKRIDLSEFAGTYTPAEAKIMAAKIKAKIEKVAGKSVGRPKGIDTAPLNIRVPVIHKAACVKLVRNYLKSKIK